MDYSLLAAMAQQPALRVQRTLQLARQMMLQRNQSHQSQLSAE